MQGFETPWALPDYGSTFQGWKPPAIPGFSVPQVQAPMPNFGGMAPSPMQPEPQQTALDRYLKTIGGATQVPAYEPPSPYMLPKIPGWLSALMALVSLGDQTGTAGTAIGQGLMQGGQMRSQQEAQRRQAEIQQKQSQREGELRNADLIYRQEAGVEDDERTLRRQIEVEKTKQAGRQQLEGYKAILKTMPPEQRPQVAASLGFEGVEAWQQLTAEEKLKEAQTANVGARTNAINTKLPVEIDYMKSGTAQRNASTGLTNEKTLTEQTMREPRLLKLQSDIEAVKKRTGLVGKQGQLLDKKIANYDDEFKLRVANINSQILKRSQSGKGEDPRKSDNQTVSDLEKLMGIARAQIKKLDEAGFMDLGAKARKMALEKEIEDAQSQIEGIIKGRQSGGGDVQKANNRVQQRLDKGEITQAQANELWRQIKAASGN